MTTQEIIQKLLELGWEPDPCITSDDYDYYLWRKFEISKTNELNFYINYTPAADEYIFIAYVIYPNRKFAQWFIWGGEDYTSTETSLIDDDYETVLRLALVDRLFTPIPR